MADGGNAPTIEALREVPMFAELPPESLSHLAEITTEAQVPAGTVLIEAKTPGSGLFVIEEGTVAVETPGERIELGPGEFFGELSLLTTNPMRTARVRATTDVRCVAIGRDAFREVLMREPSIAVTMLETLAARLSH